jgi:hypothetical protein
MKRIVLSAVLLLYSAQLFALGDPVTTESQLLGLEFPRFC